MKRSARALLRVIVLLGALVPGAGRRRALALQRLPEGPGPAEIRVRRDGRLAGPLPDVLRQHGRLRLLRVPRRSYRDQPPRRGRRHPRPEHGRARPHEGRLPCPDPGRGASLSGLGGQGPSGHRGRHRSGPGRGSAGHERRGGGPGPRGGDRGPREGGVGVFRPVLPGRDALCRRDVPPLLLQDLRRRPPRLRAGAAHHVLRGRPGQLRLSPLLPGRGVLPRL